MHPLVRQKKLITKYLAGFITQFIMIFVISAAILGYLNAPWFMARYHYYTAETVQAPVIAEDIRIKDPFAPTTIIIPALKVEAPIVMNMPSFDEVKVQNALKDGVLLFGNSAKPGEIGNVVVAGHSSGAAWLDGEYNWVFTLLDRLKPGDDIYVSYQGIIYKYVMTENEVVDPYNVRALGPTETPVLTLITCTPVGTAVSRLIVRAELQDF